MHPPAKKAMQAFVEAQKLSEAHRFADAAKQLERAIGISPDFAGAYSNLCAQYIRMGRYEEGSSAIARAIQIGQANVVDLANLAYAQFALGKYGEALASARAAVQSDPTNASAQYILGFVLAKDRRARLAAGK